MPAHFTHIYTARRVADYLASGQASDWTQASGQLVGAGDYSSVLGNYPPDYCGQLMQRWPKYVSIGAIGPDLFYFSQDYNSTLLGPESDSIMLALAVYFYYKKNKEEDWEPLLIILDKVDSTMGAIVRFLIKLFTIWHDFVAAWESTIGPFVNAANSALDDLTGGLVSEFGVAIGEMKTALVTFIEEELVSFRAIFANFDTSVDRGPDEKSMLWGDVVHYRRTTEVPRALVHEAELIRAEGGADSEENFEKALALALGWVTHVGTDTVAHSFVNEQCGGPFRNHPQRHHLIENHIDAWNYRSSMAGGTIPADPAIAATDVYPELTSCGLAFAVQLPFAEDTGHPDGVDRPGSLPDDLTGIQAALQVDGELPVWLADAITRALVASYSDPPTADGTIDDPAHPLIFGGDTFRDGVTENLLSRVITSITGRAPDDAFPLLVDAILPSPSRVPPGFPAAWQVQVCYRLMLTFYHLSYSTGGWELRKPRKPDVIIVPDASDVTNLFEPPDFSGASSGNVAEDICSAIKSLFDWAVKELDAALKLAGDLVKMLASPGSYGLRLALYALAMAVWNLTQKMHELLAHTGFFLPHGERHYPDGELMYGNEIDVELITLGHSTDAAFQQALADAFDPFGNYDKRIDLATQTGAPRDPDYPLYMPMAFVQTANGPRPGVFNDAVGASPFDGTPDAREYRAPWAYPSRSVLITGSTESDISTEREAMFPERQRAGDETDSAILTIAGPFAYGATPDAVFFTTEPGNAQLRAQYESSLSPAATELLNSVNLTPRNSVSPLGSPVTFSAYLIGQVLNQAGYVTNFNLDSDRAFGYLAWDWDRDQSVNPSPPSLDAFGRPFRAPLTPPQLAKPHTLSTDPPGWPGPSVPLRLHYIGLDAAPIVAGPSTRAPRPRRRKGGVPGGN
jgi:hypothetical protein